MYHLIIVISMLLVGPEGSGIGGDFEATLSMTATDKKTCEIARDGALQAGMGPIGVNQKVVVIEDCKFYPHN